MQLSRTYDYRQTIKNIYELQKNLTDFVGKTQTYRNTFEFINTIFNYKSDCVKFTNVSQVRKILEQRSSIHSEEKCKSLSVCNVDFKLKGNNIFKNLNCELTP